MKRRILEYPINVNRVLSRIRLESDPCFDSDRSITLGLVNLFRLISENISLITNVKPYPNKIIITNDGVHWIITVEEENPVAS